MQKHGTSEARNVVPRWRSLDKTPSHELTSSQLKIRRKDRDTSVYSYSLARWEETGSLKDAVEVLNSALAFGLKPEAKEAVSQILKPDSEAVDPIKSMAKRLLNGRNAAQSEKRRTSSRNILEEPRTIIRNLKQRLRLYPRDAISCIDLARVQVGIGQAKRASRYVDRAVKQCPNNRYIIRSAARFYTHIKEPDAALAVIKHSYMLEEDPWIQAAEISVCDLLEKTPHWTAAKIKALNQSKAPNVNRSELAAGLGALEIKNGSLKIAKKLFERSMLAPTDNSLAQLKWVQSKGILTNTRTTVPISTVELLFEANVYEALLREDARTAAIQARYWLDDEPFSSQPALIGSSIWSGVLNDLEKAIEFADLGIVASPDEPLLWNNKLVALARLGEVKKAQEILPRLLKWKNEATIEPYIHAAQGMIEFRKKNTHAGRAHYSKAVQISKTKGDRVRMFLALAYWFEEEVMCGNFEREVVENLVDVMDKMIGETPIIKRETFMVWRAIRQRILESTKQINFMIKQVIRKVTSKNESADPLLNLIN